MSLLALFVWFSFLLNIIRTENELQCSRNILEGIVVEEITDTDVPIMMTRSERILLWRYLQRAENYFEYGAGGSTLLACKVSSIQRIRTIEANALFLEGLINNSTCLQSSLNTNRFQPKIVDIGPLGDYSNPVDDTSRDLWPRYSESILEESSRKPDVILVDGRFRVASTLLSLLTVRENGVVLIHDFFIRPQYYEVLKYVDIVDCVENMIVVRLKPYDQILWKEFESDIDKYKYIVN